jgi:hypothetical protein
MTMTATTISILSTATTLENALTEHLHPENSYHITTLQAPPPTTDVLIIDDIEPHSAPDNSQGYPVISISIDSNKRFPVTYHLPKPFPLQQLLLLIKQCCTEFKDTMPIILADNYRFFPTNKLLTKQLLTSTISISLTEKEVALLMYLYNAENSAVPKTELLKAIWRYDNEADTHTLETHIYRLRQKINVNDTDADIIVTELNGYRLRR